MQLVQTSIPTVPYASPAVVTLGTAKSWARTVTLVSSAIVTVLMIAYGLLLSHWFAPAIQHPDANGYFAQGSLLASQWTTVLHAESNAQYIGMHWLLTDNEGVFAARYPPGLALVVAIVWKLFGWQGAMLISPVFAMLAVLGSFFAARRLTQSNGWGIVAMLLVGTNAAMLEHAFQDIAHMPVAACLVWGIFFLARWRDTGLLRDVFLAGLVLGFIPTLRYPDSVVAIGVGLFMLFSARAHRAIWKHWLVMIGGALIPIVPLLIRNQLVFGAFWKTGYALTNEQTGFSLKYFSDYWQGYLLMLHQSGMGVLFTLGLLGMVWTLCTRRFATGLMLLGATVPFVLLYMSYYWAPGMSTNGGGGRGPGGPGGGVSTVMRFLVPLVPMFAFGAVLLLSEMLKSAPRTAKVLVPTTLIAIHLLLTAQSTLQSMDRQRESKAMLAIATKELEKHVPAGAVVVASNGVQQHLDFVRTWKLADPTIVNGGGGPGGGGARRLMTRDADDPSPQQRSKIDARSKLYTGTTREKQMQFWSDVDSWASGKGVYLIGRESDITRMAAGLDREQIEEVARFKMPDQPQPPRDDAQQGPPDMMGGPPGGPGAGPPDFAPRQRRGFGGGGGGPFGPGFQPGDEVVISRVVSTK
jgi:hypothetical protein